MNVKLLSDLKYGPTVKLFVLGVVTYAVYFAHYMKRQTAFINQHCEPEERISEGLITFIMVISYLSLGLFIAYLFVDETHPIAALSGLVDFVNNVAFIVWGFKARKRMNQLLASEAGETGWFHGLWTFIFTPLYFNFKVNQLSEIDAIDTPVSIEPSAAE